MSRLIYGLSGEGWGHTSRALAIGSLLRQRGHEVRFCCGGVARTVLERRGETVIPVPSLAHVVEGNQIQFWKTIWTNGPAILQSSATIDRLCEVFTSYDPALLIVDFEPFSPRAAEQLGVPVVSLNNQQIVTETQYRIRPHEGLHAFMARVAIRLISPQDPAHILLPSFFDLPLKRPARTTLLPPILRADVCTLDPVNGEHVLVYYNHGAGAENVLQALEDTRYKAVVYGFSDEAASKNYQHLEFRPPSQNGFLEDLATCRAVICTAGFTLLSEALYLGKPILAVPNGGIYEQTLNAQFLSQLGLGESATQERLTSETIRDFLDRADQYRAPCASQVECGTQLAVDHIERILRRILPSGREETLPFHPE